MFNTEKGQGNAYGESLSQPPIWRSERPREPLRDFKSQISNLKFPSRPNLPLVKNMNFAKRTHFEKRATHYESG
jgi:hypothetical protein